MSECAMQHGGPEHGDALHRDAHNAEPDTQPDDSGADSPWCHSCTDGGAHNGHAQVALRWIAVSIGKTQLAWGELFTVAARRRPCTGLYHPLYRFVPALYRLCTTFVPAL